MDSPDLAANDECNDPDEELSRHRRKMRKLTESVTAIATATVLALSTIHLEPPKIGNCRYTRLEALQYVRSWDDDMFQRQFRLCREDFGNLLTLIAPLIARNVVKATASSGSAICPELRLMITLRILAGAKHLDMIWYRVSVDHVQEYVVDCQKAINSAVDNINIPKTDAGWRLESEKFRAVLTAKHDSMGDITAYEQTALHKNSTYSLLPTSIPDRVSYVLDEAYSSIGGCHLTPFTSHQLKKAYMLDDISKTLYLWIWLKDIT